MQRCWFQPMGWIHRPVSWQGYFLTVVFTGVVLQAWLAIDRQSHSVSDTLFGFFPYGVAGFLLFDWICTKCSKACLSNPIDSPANARDGGLDV